LEYVGILAKYRLSLHGSLRPRKPAQVKSRQVKSFNLLHPGLAVESSEKKEKLGLSV
jgi:hypothetical protein